MYYIVCIELYWFIRNIYTYDNWVCELSLMWKLSSCSTCKRVIQTIWNWIYNCFIILENIFIMKINIILIYYRNKHHIYIYIYIYIYILYKHNVYYIIYVVSLTSWFNMSIILWNTRFRFSSNFVL